MSNTPQYQQDFNKQLSEQLQKVRKQQPNHIPVYSMKYKNASKYLVDDLKQSLALFPKQFKLKKIHQIISRQSLQYCKQKLMNDSKVKDKGEDFQLPIFHLYTIEILEKALQEKSKLQQGNKNSESKKQKPIGKFVKLDLQMTFEQAFSKYSRENVLTVVYTDAQEIRLKYAKTQKTVQKWLQRILFVILALIIIPYLMRGQSQEEVKSGSNEMKPGVSPVAGNISATESNHTYQDNNDRLQVTDTLTHHNSNGQSIDQHDYYEDEAI